MYGVDVDPEIQLIYRISDLIGVLLMGIIGGTIARQKKYDIIGFLFIALLSGLGGGMLRDVLIQQGTVAAVAEQEYLMLAFTGALIARFTYFKGKAWEIFRAHGDAIVSGVWAATGCVKALAFDLPVVSAIMMGVLTAVGGSMIRDVVVGRTPAIFGDNQPTAFPALITAVSMVLFDWAGYFALGMIISPLVGIAISVIAYWSGWQISTNQEWAPVNMTVSQVADAVRYAESRGRDVARELEPKKTRAWRHDQMEKALQRRRDSQVSSGERTQEEADADTASFRAVTSDSDSDSDDSDASDDAATQQFTRDLVDTLLADEKLTDELLTRMQEQQDKK